ncbi:MAG TPA: hypothetical protein VEJ87_04630 [Acidimicrobiales bacterium]|nr:hypothetical protein [Acidimicrobiales bacterium]
MESPDERVLEDLVFADQSWILRFGCDDGNRHRWSLVEDGRVQRSFGLPEMTYEDLMTRISPPAPFPVAQRLAHEAVSALGESPRRRLARTRQAGTNR